MMLHYLGKLKDQKFALCMHVKHVSSVTVQSIPAMLLTSFFATCDERSVMDGAVTLYI